MASLPTSSRSGMKTARITHGKTLSPGFQSNSNALGKLFVGRSMLAIIKILPAYILARLPVGSSIYCINKHKASQVKHFRELLESFYNKSPTSNIGLMLM